MTDQLRTNVVRITGERHERADNRECLCGCQHVDGLPGTVIEECAALSLVIAEFWVACPAGGSGRYQQVAYDV